MGKLVRLEWKKNRAGRYILYAVVTTALLITLLVAIAGELKAEETAPLEMYGKSMVAAMVDLFMNMTYMIFTGVMLASYVVGAYEKKTMGLMFSYPISRRKILLSKFLAVWIFNFAALTLSKIFSYVFLILAGPYTQVTLEDLQMGTVSFWLDLVISSVSMVSISFIALLAGLKMKSSKAVIVTAVIIVCCTQGSIGRFTLVGNVPFYILFLALAAVSVFLSIGKVELKDV